MKRIPVTIPKGFYFQKYRKIVQRNFELRTEIRFAIMGIEKTGEVVVIEKDLKSETCCWEYLANNHNVKR